MVNHGITVAELQRFWKALGPGTTHFPAITGPPAAPSNPLDIQWFQVRSKSINPVAVNVSSRHIVFPIFDMRRLTSAATQFLEAQ